MFVAPVLVFYNVTFGISAFILPLCLSRKAQQLDITNKGNFVGYLGGAVFSALVMFVLFTTLNGAAILDGYKSKIGIQTKNFDLIESLPYQHQRDRKYYDTALEHQDVEICNRIGDTGTLRDACFSNLSSKE